MTDDKRNVEIKARIPGGKDDFERCIAIAQKLNNISYQLLEQRDVFFNSPLGGRLKMRYLNENSSAELIYYNRIDNIGPKLSTFNKIDVVKDPEVLEKILTQTNGAIGVVIKERHLYLWNGTTRIHLDNVQNLGYFIEFEVCLKPEQTILEGETVAQQLLRVFQIQREDLIPGAYIDELIDANKLKKT